MLLNVFHEKNVYDHFYVLKIIKVPYFGKLCDNSTI
jgi:hypothetical protein